MIAECAKESAGVAARLLLLKVGGNELDDQSFVAGLAKAVKDLRDSGRVPIIVHGGGRGVTELQGRLGLQERWIEGLRVTDDGSIACVEMVLSGTMNKRIVRELAKVGIRSVGLSGVDDSLVQVRKLVHPAGDLGRVGEVTAVNPALLDLLVGQGIVPVISPVSVGERDFESYNVNADQIAAAIAVRLGVHTMVFLSNVPGVIVDGAVMPRMLAADTEELITQGTIHGGMVPKIRGALDAVEQGVEEVVITNLEGLTRGTGTSFVRG